MSKKGKKKDKESEEEDEPVATVMQMVFEQCLNDNAPHMTQEKQEYDHVSIIKNVSGQ